MLFWLEGGEGEDMYTVMFALVLKEHLRLAPCFVFSAIFPNVYVLFTKSIKIQSCKPETEITQTKQTKTWNLTTLL